MNIDITSYQPVSQSKTCVRCSSATTTWIDTMPSARKGMPGKWHLCEIFTLDGEDVANKDDLHARYCTNPLGGWRRKEEISDPKDRRFARQAELNAAAADYMDNETDEIKTDGHPFCCPTCGAGVIDGLDNLRYDFTNDKPTKPHAHGDVISVNAMDAARIRGTKFATKIPFAGISERMESVHRMMVDAKEFGDRSETENAELGSEYLMLNKRLNTEIPK